VHVKLISVAATPGSFWNSCWSLVHYLCKRWMCKINISSFYLYRRIHMQAYRSWQSHLSQIFRKISQQLCLQYSGLEINSAWAVVQLRMNPAFCVRYVGYS